MIFVRASCLLVLLVSFKFHDFRYWTTLLSSFYSTSLYSLILPSVLFIACLLSLHIVTSENIHRILCLALINVYLNIFHIFVLYYEINRIVVINVYMNGSYCLFLYRKLAKKHFFFIQFFNNYTH